MRGTTTSTALAVLLLGNPATAFAPTNPKLATRPASLPSTFQHQMVKDKQDPLGILETDVMSQDSRKRSRQSTNPTPFLVDLFERTMGNEIVNQNNMKLAAAALAVALTILPLPSEAAMSGGRMGGSFSAPSRSLSVPSRSYSGGGGYSSGYSRGFPGYSSRPSVVVSPGIGFGYSPFVNPFSPFGGYYGGGAGVISYSRGPSFFDLFLLGGFLFAVTSFFRSDSTSTLGSSSSFDLLDSSTATSSLGAGTSVVQVSVALEVPNRDDPNSILGVLNRLSRSAKTDSRVGIQNLTSQVALELLRRRSSIVSASSSYEHFRDRSKAGRAYEAKAIRERSKFEKETVSKYGGVDYGAGSSSTGGGGMVVDGKATMSVVTLVLAIDGDSTKVPRVNSISDLEEALRKIASDSKVDDCLQSVEILWTPEDRSETLTLRDVVADYPELRSV